MRRKLQEPTAGRLVLGLLWRPGFDLNVALPQLEKFFGKTRARSEVYPFSYTDYYRAEMGHDLKKCFLEMEGCHSREALIEFKHEAMRLEDLFLSAGARQLNIDPLLVMLENILISTSKNFPHRVYLGRGVYGDLVLIRRKSGFESLPWSYPDYIDQTPFFEKIHKALRSEVLPRGTSA